MVAYSDFWLGHWRRSVENLWIMRKVFGFLLFMILILPSLGQTTVRALMEKFIKKQTVNGTDTDIINWQCIFLPDNGAFFVNYVTTCALIGTGLEIVRFPELFMYAVRLCSARSTAEISSVRRAIVYEFPFGINYAWMLLVFALTVSYSVICPLITPFGLSYFIIKHGVDRYNLYFAYKRSKINKNIHGCAVNCVCISLLIQQLLLLFFNTIRTSPDPYSTKAIFSITMFTIFCLLFAAQMFFHAFKVSRDESSSFYSTFNYVFRVFLQSNTQSTVHHSPELVQTMLPCSHQQLQCQHLQDKTSETESLSRTLSATPVNLKL